MPDLYFSESGDLRIAAGGDLAVTETRWREDAQNAYIRIMTAPGDFLLYKQLGTPLEELYGMPQSRETAQHGINLIQDALNREGLFLGRKLMIDAVPTGPQTIRFDVKINDGVNTTSLLSIEKDLGINY
jgi:hypothetical protein